MVRKFDRTFIFIIFGFSLIMASLNLFVLTLQKNEGNNSYKVPINRMEKLIDENEDLFLYDDSHAFCALSVPGQDTSQIPSVYFMPAAECDTAAFNRFLHADDFSYELYATAKYLYRIAYFHQTDHTPQTLLLLNGVGLALLLLLSAILLYIRKKLILPFADITTLPYELAKGNLAIPVKEEKTKYFGKFLWGMDLLRENLEEQKERELALHRDRKMLLLSLSHDIKTPLSVIKLYANALSKNLYKTEEKRQEIAQGINHNTDLIEEYISDIVSASHEDFLQFDVYNREFYIKEVLSYIKEYYQDKMVLNQISFTVDAFSNCLIYGDADRLTEVMQNLIENAIKYGDGKCIQIRTEHDSEEYTILVRNSGCTLPSKELVHIFSSFFRGSNAASQKGSGLGLYICRNLIHLMEGEIFAEIVSVDTENWLEIRIVLRLA